MCQSEPGDSFQCNTKRGLRSVEVSQEEVEMRKRGSRRRESNPPHPANAISRPCRCRNSLRKQEIRLRTSTLPNYAENALEVSARRTSGAFRLCSFSTHSTNSV